MSDDERDHEQLRRRLADEGQATAPPDLAPAVMRQVRSEPRRRDHRVLRPVATLLAAAVLVLAALLGISRLGGGASSSGGAAGAVSAPEKSAGAANHGTGSVPSAAAHGAIIRHVDSDTLKMLFGTSSLPACASGDRLKVTAPSSELPRLKRRLRGAAADAAAGSRTRDVELHRARRGQTQIRLTCP